MGKRKRAETNGKTRILLGFRVFCSGFLLASVEFAWQRCALALGEAKSPYSGKILPELSQ